MCTSKVTIATTSRCSISKTVFQIQMYLVSNTVVSLSPVPPISGCWDKAAVTADAWLPSPHACVDNSKPGWCTGNFSPSKALFLLQGNFTKGHIFLISYTGQEKSKLSLGKLEMPCKILTLEEGCACIPIFQQRSIFAVVKTASAL